MGNKIKDKIEILDNLLNQEKIFGIQVGERIHLIIESILEEYIRLDYDSTREIRGLLLKIFQNSYISSVNNLIVLMNDFLVQIEKININKRKPNIYQEYNIDEILPILKEIQLDMYNRNHIELSTYKLEKHYNEKTRKQLYSLTSDLIDASHDKFDDNKTAEENINFLIILYCIHHNFAKELGCLEYFYCSINSLFQNLHFFNFFQISRDLGEEVLKTSISDGCQGS